MENRDRELKKIKEEIIACQKCSLGETRNLPVVGEGNHQSKIMLCGEAPGAQEDKTGSPFCGAAGKILDRLLESISLERKEVYVTNILKCRPPQNRNPQQEEIKACSPFLDRQIKIIQPEIICPLGNFATHYLLRHYKLEQQAQKEGGGIKGISQLHGRIFPVNNIFYSLKIIPLYHPAVATYNANMIEALKKDFAILKKMI
jgi:DNA polymerase